MATVDPSSVEERTGGLATEPVSEVVGGLATEEELERRVSIALRALFERMYDGSEGGPIAPPSIDDAQSASANPPRLTRSWDDGAGHGFIEPIDDEAKC